MENLRQLVNEQKDRIVAMRRDLHRIPETAYTEKKTSAYVADYLNNLRLEVQTGIAQYGVVGLMKTGRPGPTLMIRADMDALPVTERNDLPFKSTVTGEFNGQEVGVMHACGHDIHTTVGLGVEATFVF